MSDAHDYDVLETLDLTYRNWGGRSFDPQEFETSFHSWGLSKRAAFLDNGPALKERAAASGSMQKYTKVARLITNCDAINQRLIKSGL